MYVLKIETEDGAFRHAVARIEWPALSAAADGTTRHSLFLDYFCNAAALWLQLPALSASLRVDVSPRRTPITWHGLTTSVEDGEQLRQAMAALMRLDGVENAVVSAPGDLADFQRTYAAPGDGWRTLDCEPLTTSAGGELFSAARMFDRLPELLSGAVAMGHALTYQAMFQPSRPRPDLLRRARKAAASLQRLPAVPRRLVEIQETVCRRLEAADLLAEEAVSIEPGGEAWLAQWLRRNASLEEAASFDASARDALTLDADTADAFEHHVHPHLLIGASAGDADPSLVAKFWKRTEAASLFRCDALWRPRSRPDDPPPVSSLPVLFGGGGGARTSPQSTGWIMADAKAADPFFFVSYAHKDMDGIRPILARVAEGGVRLWIDEQIAVGEEWDTRLETMIASSSGLLVFLSPRYVASKHCRRELKFADALDKNIYASAFEPLELGGGLGYIFASLQYATGSTDKIAERLLDRLRAELAQAQSGGASGPGGGLH